MTTATTAITNTADNLAMSNATAPKSKSGSRKKATDDLSYVSVDASMIVAGSKRSALDKADGEPRTKRKRVDHTQIQHITVPLNGNSAKHSNLDVDNSTSLIDFTTLPLDALHRYILHYDLIPAIYPSPLSAVDPPPPAALLEPMRRPSPRAISPASSTVTPANRPRRGRDSKEASRRRSSRLLEEEMRAEMSQIPVLADVGEIKNVLALVAHRHFKETSVKEVETLAAFMQTVVRDKKQYRG